MKKRDVKEGTFLLKKFDRVDNTLYKITNSFKEAKMKISWNPGELLKISGSYWMGCTLQTGVKLDIFSVINENSKTANNISKEINGELEGTRRLLDALVAMGLLTKKDDNYANTKESLMYLRKSSPQYLGYMISHHHNLVESWAKLPQVIKTGKPSRESVAFSDEETIENFIMGMFNNALFVAPQIAEQVDLSKYNNMLDLGGGPGTYCIHFCLKYKNLKGTILDLPTTRIFAEKTINRFKVKDRVSFVEGNFVNDEIKGSYDVVWLSHILHGEGPEVCEQILKKASAVLKPGGVILIHDFILNDTMDGPLFPALFSLNMLVGTGSGQSYSEKLLFEMLRKTGFKNINRIPIDTPNSSGIVSGEIL